MRPGEHACSRYARDDDRDRIAAAFVRDGLVRGHKVVYLCDREDLPARAARLDHVAHETVGTPAPGQLVVLATHDVYTRDGTFEVDRVLATARDEHARALAEGWPAVRFTGEMAWACDGVPGCDHLVEYERRLDGAPRDPTLTLLCQYDERRFAQDTLADVCVQHGVDFSPELAPLCRDGQLSAALTRPGPTLRLTGELDLTRADAVAELLDAYGPLRLDLADLTFIDLAGLRALRHPAGPPRITAASRPVRRLIDLLAWDA
jgi:hypothetical protein